MRRENLYDLTDLSDEPVDYPIFVNEDGLQPLRETLLSEQVVHDPCPAPTLDDTATRG